MQNPKVYKQSTCCMATYEEKKKLYLYKINEMKTTYASQNDVLEVIQYVLDSIDL